MAATNNIKHPLGKRGFFGAAIWLSGFSVC